MKTVPALFAAASLIFVSVSCDKHSWEETQVLHENMHKEHADSHHNDAKKGEHEKKDAHAAEKKDAAKH